MSLLNFIKKKGIIKLVIVFITITQILNAQDTHYWTNQFGTRGSVLGNSVAGGVFDLSAIYYNPGCFARVDSNTVSVSANVYQYDMLKINNGAGQGLNLESNQFIPMPSMLAGSYQLKNSKYKKHHFGYILIAPTQTSISTNFRKDALEDVIPEFNNRGKEEYIGQFALKSKLSEQWAGGTYAYEINKHWGVGFTLFAAYRDQSIEKSFVSRVSLPLDSDYGLFVTPMVNYSDVQSASITSIRGFSKLGISYTSEQIDFGLTFNTPSLSIYNDAVVQRDELFGYLNTDSLNFSAYTAAAQNYSDFIYLADSFRFDISNYNFVINDRQSSATSKMKTSFKTPFSVGGGLVIKSKKQGKDEDAKKKWFFSFEYFGAVDAYFLVQPEVRPVIRPVSASFNKDDAFNSTDFIGIIESRRSVLNLALGYERYINKDLRLLMSFRTNNSYYDVPFSEMEFSQTFWNIWHFSLGGIYRKKNTIISAGINYFDGFGITSPYIVMSNPTEAGWLQGNTNFDANVTMRSLGITIGFTQVIGKANNEIKK
jgi:long-subunit fatty acid transport protein